MNGPRNETAPLAGGAAENTEAGGFNGNSTGKVEGTQVDLAQAARFLTLLDEEADHWHFRAIHPASGAVRNYTGSFEQLAKRLAADNAAGFGVYVTVNEGGTKAADITRIRAVFADFDPPKTAAMPAGLPLEPHIIVESSRGKHHAYWLVDGLSAGEFKATQQAIAARFGSDPQVCDPSRVMRLPGFIHCKPADDAHDGAPFQSRIVHESGQLPYSVDAIRQAFPVAAPSSTLPVAPAVHGDIMDGGRDNTLASLAGTMRRRGMSEPAILAALSVENASRCKPPLPAADVERIARSVARYEPSDPALRDGGPVPDTLATAMRAALTPFTAEEWTAAALPHPHAFMGDGMGLFPCGEATVLGAPGREGKTLTTVALAVAYVLGRPVAGLVPEPGRSVVIYSAEDDRVQYAAKLLAQRALLSPEESAIVAERIIVADLKSAGVAEWRELVQMVDRRPARAPSVAALVDALRNMASSRFPPGLVIFETGSTLSEADEDGAGHRAMIGAVKDVAEQTDLAAVLVHHTSQAASNNLPTLNVSVADIRGATQLVFNSRQNLLLVNLGSDDEPFHETDMRTMLRRLAAPGYPGRVVVLVPLDTSKARDPRPVFLRWEPTDYGPALRELPRLSPEVAGLHWRRLLAVLRGQRAEAREEAKQDANAAKVAAVVAAVQRLAAKGEPASARRVSLEAGHAAGWADRYLQMAVDAGQLAIETARIPNTKGETAVYVTRVQMDAAA